MELLTLSLVLILSIAALVGTTAVVTFVVTLWYGQFYWQPIDNRRHYIPLAQRLVGTFLFPVRLFCRHDIVAPPSGASPREPVLFLGEPHGLFVVSGVLSFVTNADAARLCGVRGIRVGVHRYLLRVPFLRDLLGALGCVSVGENSLIDCWANGLSTLVFPEGVHGLGARLTPPPAILPAVRLAYDYAIPIRLVTFAGERDLFITYDVWGLRWLRYWSYRLLGVPFTPFRCRFARPCLVTHLAPELLRRQRDETLEEFARRCTDARNHE